MIEMLEKVYVWNKDLFDDWMEQLEIAIDNQDPDRSRYILSEIWRLVHEMRTLATQYPKYSDLFMATFTNMKNQVDVQIRKIEDMGFHKWHSLHYENYQRTGPYTYSDYPYYGQPQREPQGDRPFSDRPWFSDPY